MKPLPRKDQIRIQAETLFREKGYAATSMRDLAEGLGIEAASLYNHIASKEEILRQICFSMADAFFSAIESAIATESTAKAKLRAASLAHLGVIAGNLNAVAVFLHEWRHLNEPYLNEFRTQRRRYERIFVSLIDEGIMMGTIRDIDAEVTARTMLSAMNWSYEWMKPTGKFSYESVSNEIIGILIDGISAGA